MINNKNGFGWAGLPQKAVFLRKSIKSAYCFTDVINNRTFYGRKKRGRIAMKGMEGIHGIKGVNYVAEIESGRMSGKKEDLAAEPRMDMLEVSEEYADERTELLSEPEWKGFFEGLRKQFSGITFYVGGSILDCVSADKNGVSAVISHSFMEKLLSGGEEAAEYRERLVKALECFQEVSHGEAGTGIFIDTEKAACWKFAEEKEELREPYSRLDRVSDMLKEFELSNTRSRERWKKNQQKMLTGGVSNLYAMAAMARDKAGTVSVVARANRQISSLKMAAAGAKGAEAMKINAVVNSLRKLIGKCNSKMRKIEKAEQAEAEYKRALKKKTAKKAEEYKREMNRRRRILRCENEGIKNAGMLEDWKNSSNFRRMDEMDRIQAEYQAANTVGAGSSGAADMGGSPAGGSIAVTETIVF